jgi:deglycase
MSGRPGLAVALVEDGYAELEFWYPVLRLREEGAEVFIAGPSGDHTYYSQLGYPVVPDGDLAAAVVKHPNVLLVPGGDAGRRLAASAGFAEMTQSLAARGAVIAATGDFRDLDPGLHCPTPDDLPLFVPALLAALARGDA